MPEGSQMFRAARSIRRRLPGPLRARRAPVVRGGAEHPMGPPEALPHPKISKHSGWCGTPSGGSHPAVRANTTREASGDPTLEREYRGFPGANEGCPGKETPGGPAPWDQFAPGVSEGTRSLSSA